MAFAASNLSSEPRAFSIGPLKLQIMTYTAASADVSGSLTADKLSSIDCVVVSGGIHLTAQPTISGNTATLAFADPGATVAGQILVFGR